MAKRKVMLVFSKEVVTEPIVYTLGQQFNISTNILKADISEDRGWIALVLTGKVKDIDNGIVWVVSRGVRVESLADDITED